jgi:hypothetical protein
MMADALRLDSSVDILVSPDILVDILLDIILAQPAQHVLRATHLAYTAVFSTLGQHVGAGQSPWSMTSP